MIKMDLPSDVSDLKLSNSLPYIDIKPVNEMSEKDMSAFITKEFEAAQKEAETDTYDKLLSEVFNVSEKDVQIDYDVSDAISATLESFRSERWPNLSDEERRSSMECLVKILSEELKLGKTPEILLTDEIGNTYGFYDEEDCTVSINRAYLENGLEIADTIAHELRHAYQYKRADKPETREDTLFRVNLENYLSPCPLPAGGYLFFTDYMDQYVEVDARLFASKVTEGLK